MARHNDWGRKAEQIATEHLIRQGYTIRERNWRPGSSHLETDIITQHNNTIIFIEVKARQSDDYDPAEAVDHRKITRLVRAAESYLLAQPFDYEYRFDIITITGTEQDYKLEHIKDAFLPPLC